MDWAILIYAILASIVFIWFSRKQKYYQKTADTYGREYADKIFKVIKLCGYLMLIGSVCYLIFLIFLLY